MGLNKSRRGRYLMNSFLVALSPVKNTIVTKDDYSIKIHEAFNKIFHEMGINDFRVSSFFGYFFENVFIVDKEKNYKNIVFNLSFQLQRVVKILLLIL